MQHFTITHNDLTLSFFTYMELVAMVKGETMNDRHQIEKAQFLTEAFTRHIIPFIQDESKPSTRPLEARIGGPTEEGGSATYQIAGRGEQEVRP